jgi:hypothetical protein
VEQHVEQNQQQQLPVSAPSAATTRVYCRRPYLTLRILGLKDDVADSLEGIVAARSKGGEPLIVLQAAGG